MCVAIIRHQHILLKLFADQQLPGMIASAPGNLQDGEAENHRKE
jgi:hypothetical protein